VVSNTYVISHTIFIWPWVTPHLDTFPRLNILTTWSCPWATPYFLEYPFARKVGTITRQSLSTAQLAVGQFYITWAKWYPICGCFSQCGTRGKSLWGWCPYFLAVHVNIIMQRGRVLSFLLQDRVLGRCSDKPAEWGICLKARGLCTPVMRTLENSTGQGTVKNTFFCHACIRKAGNKVGNPSILLYIYIYTFLNILIIYTQWAPPPPPTPPAQPIGYMINIFRNIYIYIYI